MNNHIEAMLDFCTKHDNAFWDRAAAEQGVDVSVYAPFKSTYVAEKARKYIKVYRQSKTSCQIFMFIDEAGNIFKPASYKAPAKHSRGHISEWKRSLTFTQASGVISVNYLRG